MTDTLTGRPGAQRLAVTSGGTIPDRGPVRRLPAAGAGEPGRRVGELDEEMVYESRVGDVFLLGSTSWRIEEITPDRVLVTPGPGAAGRRCRSGRATPRAGRSSWAGRSARSCARWPRRRPTKAAGAGRGGRAGRLGRRQPAGLPGRAAGGDPAPARRPDAAGRAVPRRAGRLAAGRALAVRGAGQRAVGAGDRAPGCASGTGWTSSRCTPTTGSWCACRRPTASRPAAEVALFEPDEIEPLVTDEVGGSALFASRFRECAARALLLPQPRPAPAHAAVAAAAAGRAAARRGPRVRRRSRSCWRPCGSACRTSSTCRGWSG